MQRTWEEEQVMKIDRRIEKLELIIRFLSPRSAAEYLQNATDRVLSDISEQTEQLNRKIRALSWESHTPQERQRLEAAQDKLARFSNELTTLRGQVPFNKDALRAKLEAYISEALNKLEEDAIDASMTLEDVFMPRPTPVGPPRFAPQRPPQDLASAAAAQRRPRLRDEAGTMAFVNENRSTIIEVFEEEYDRLLQMQLENRPRLQWIRNARGLLDVEQSLRQLVIISECVVPVANDGNMPRFMIILGYGIVLDHNLLGVSIDRSNLFASSDPRYLTSVIRAIDSFSPEEDDTWRRTVD